MPDVGYKRSFEKLGYSLPSPRNHWSSENETGVCLSLWSDEFRTPDDRLMELDTRTDCGPMETWNSVGKNLREQHLRSARDKFDGWIDVVIRQGGPEDDSAPSNPWDVPKRKHKFRLQEFDEETGHFSIKLQPYNISNS